MREAKEFAGKEETSSSYLSHYYSISTSLSPQRRRRKERRREKDTSTKTFSCVRHYNTSLFCADRVMTRDDGSDGVMTRDDVTNLS